MHYSNIDLRVYHVRVCWIGDIHRRVVGRYSTPPSCLGGLEEHRQFWGHLSRTIKERRAFYLVVLSACTDTSRLSSLLDL